MREDRAAINSDAEMARQGSSVLASRGVEGGGDIRGVVLTELLF